MHVKRDRILPEGHALHFYHLPLHVDLCQLVVNKQSKVVTWRTFSTVLLHSAICSKWARTTQVTPVFIVGAFVPG